ncbi:MAG TPA: alpha/beta fold hydrolase [Bryobacteraceae bacterium]|nr:alpha/beta fold hydrolase [Bryobacteraceae bacterium]
MTAQFATSCIAGILAVSFGAAATAGPRETRADFLKMIDRPRVPLEPEVREMPGAGLFQVHFSIATEAGERVPGILIRQFSAGRKPAVIVLHGTGGKKEGEIPLLKQLAGKGFTAIAIDGRHHGERTRSGSGSAEYSTAILRTYRTQKGHPFLYDTVWDVLRLIDYLETRDDVDAKRIGVIGFSKGGMETYLAAAVDFRIAVAVPCVGVQSFRWALDNDSWQSRVGTFQVAMDGASKDDGLSKVDAGFVRKFYDRVVPGIYSKFDGPAMVPLIAPRPLLMINGDSDPRTPRPGLMECVAAAEKAYVAASAQDKLVLHLQENTGHQVRPASLDLAVAWFVKWLRP